MTKRFPRRRRGRLFAIGAGLAVLAGAAAPTAGFGLGPTVAQSAAQIPPLPPGLARVWIIRQFEPGETLRTTMVYIDGAPVMTADPGTAFYRDVAPGAYRFTVDSCTRDSGQASELTLAPGMRVDLEVQSLQSLVSPDCQPPTNFYIRPIPPRWAEMYFQQVAYLGRR